LTSYLQHLQNDLNKLIIHDPMRTIKSLQAMCTLLLVAGYLLSGCSSSSSVTGSQQLNPQMQAQAASNATADRTADISTYRIRPGDEIEVLVWEQPNFNVLTTVSSTGRIAVPLVGEMRIAGLTQEEFETELTRRLSDYIRDDINLTISIRNTESLMVSVFGMVNRPDNYPVVDEISIFRLLSTAGGPTETANMRKVHLYRQSGVQDSAILDLTEYLDSGLMDDPAILVRQGDIIYIPRKDNAVREMSEFLRDVVVLFGIFRIFN